MPHLSRVTAGLARTTVPTPTNRDEAAAGHRGRRWLVWLAFGVLSLATMGAGPPVLTGTGAGSLPLYPEQISAYQASRQTPPLGAGSAVLADRDTGQVLAAISPDQPRPIASLTKIMTALLTLERANLQDPVVISPSALVGESSMGLQAGEVLTVEDLLWGLLLNSGNDAAVALAEHIAGSEADFVALMNARAAELGLTQTHFANAHGMDAPEHFSSAADLRRLTETALAYPLFRQIVATQSYVAAGHPLVNRNELLAAYPGADGVKTGTTDLAGQNLIATVTRGGHQALAVLLGSNDRYADAIGLFDYYFATFAWQPAPQPAGRAAWIKAPDGRPLRVTAPGAPDLFLPRWQWPVVRTQAIIASVPTDLAQPAGVVRWYLGNDLLGEAPAFLSVY